jgi:ribosomal protein S18 acetylase RimI-like enzyme
MPGRITASGTTQRTRRESIPPKRRSQTPLAVLVLRRKNSETRGLIGLLLHWKEEGEIGPVIVSSHYRNQRIGTMLLQHIVSETKQMGVQYLSIRPVARNQEAISLFIKLGFNTIGHVDLFGTQPSVETAHTSTDII